MGIFGKSKSDLEREIERLKAENRTLRKQNNLLLMFYDAWITRIRKDWSLPNTTDAGPQYMSWDDSGSVLNLEEAMLKALNEAKSRSEKVLVYARWIPEIVESILCDVRYTPDLFYDNPPQVQKKYEAVMAKVRMYFPAFGDVKNYSDVRIGDPPNQVFLP